MGKNLIIQRRGRGTSTYRAPSHRYYGEIKYRPYDDNERNTVVYGTVQDLIACPGHFAPLAKIKYETGEEVLISAPLNLRVGDVVASGASAPVQTGNVLPLKNIPEGTAIYNLECRPGDGGKLVRTAGVFARVIGKVGEGEGILVTLPSKKQKTFQGECCATVGVIAGDGRTEKPFLKAGNAKKLMRSRGRVWPITKGQSMIAASHPHGGGRHKHAGKPTTVSRNAPPGRKVGMIAARQTGRAKRAIGT